MGGAQEVAVPGTWYLVSGLRGAAHSTFERNQSPSNRPKIRKQLPVLLQGEKTKIMTDIQLGLHLARRPDSDAEEPGELSRTTPTCPFGDIRRH